MFIAEAVFNAKLYFKNNYYNSVLFIASFIHTQTYTHRHSQIHAHVCACTHTHIHTHQVVLAHKSLLNFQDFCKLLTVRQVA